MGPNEVIKNSERILNILGYLQNLKKVPSSIHELIKENNKYNYKSLSLCKILGINSCSKCNYKNSSNCQLDMTNYISLRSKSEKFNNIIIDNEFTPTDKDINDEIIEMIEKVIYKSEDRNE